MTPDDLDRILASENLLEPSAGFAHSVMEAVHHGVNEPPAKRFPWKRFAGGMSGCLVIAAAGAAIPARIAPEVGYATAFLLITLALTSLPRLLDSAD